MPREHYFTPLRVGVFCIAVAIGIVLALTPIQGAERFPELGEVAERTVVAPADLSFASTHLTELEREAARAAVQPRFMYDPDIQPAQLAALRRYLDEVSAARLRLLTPSPAPDDSEDASEDANGAGASAREVRFIDSRISERSHEALLNLSDSQFFRVEREAIGVLGTILERRINEDQLGEHAARGRRAARSRHVRLPGGAG